MAHDPWLDRAVDHEHSQRAWLDFQPLFSTQRIGNYPLFMLAHVVTHQTPDEPQRDIPTHVLDAIIESTYTVLPNRTMIGVEVQDNPYDLEFLTEHFHKLQIEIPVTRYPINRILFNWIRANEKNHRLVVELATLIWRYLISNPSTWGNYVSSVELYHRQILLADRAAYIAYIALSHELLLVYPNLAYLLTDYDTLDQIRMEHVLWSDMVTEVWEWTIGSYWPQASQIVCFHQENMPAFSDFIRDIVVNPQDLIDAGVDIEALAACDKLKYVFNCAYVPPTMANAVVQTYTLYGRKYIASFSKRLLTHADQIALQVSSGKNGPTRTSGFPSSLKCEPDPDCCYPETVDVYETFRINAVVGRLRPVVPILDQFLGLVQAPPQGTPDVILCSLNMYASIQGPAKVPSLPPTSVW